MQENTNINTSYTVNESNSLKDLILNIRDWIHYFLSKKYIIILFGLLGGGLGFTYALLKKPVYIASTSFVLETGGNKGGASFLFWDCFRFWNRSGRWWRRII